MYLQFILTSALLQDIKGCESALSRFMLAQRFSPQDHIKQDFCEELKLLQNR